MNFAPIVLFVFNRPNHTRKTIESLKKNTLSDKSDLFVFADAARNEKEIRDVEAVRSIVESIEGFRSVTLHKNHKNLGLATSVINGVSAVIEKYGRVIVVEDDLVFSPFFLQYMNESLEFYESSMKVFSIGGYSPPLEIPDEYVDDSYLSYRCCTWGWATWLNRWQKADWDMHDYEEFSKDTFQISRFNRGGDDMSQILKLQMDGKISSWGIRWDYAHYKNDAFCLRPTYSIVGNTGNDGSGVHCGATSKFDVSINMQSSFPYINSERLLIDEEINRRFATFYDGRKRLVSDPLSTSLVSNSIFRRIMSRVCRLGKR